MPSNYTVKVHLESYLKWYVVKVCSENKSNPIIFASGSFFLKILMPMLISKREYDHRKTVEAKYINHKLDDTIEIMLPWTRGKIDVRYKHYISPLDEIEYRKFIRSEYSLIKQAESKNRMSEGETFWEVINRIK